MQINENMVIFPFSLKMLWIFLQAVLSCVSSSSNQYNQLTAQFLLACFCVFQALNSMYELHQHTISANRLCLGCLIYADAQSHIWDSFTFPCLSFVLKCTIWFHYSLIKLNLCHNTGISENWQWPEQIHTVCGYHILLSFQRWDRSFFGL